MELSIDDEYCSLPLRVQAEGFGKAGHNNKVFTGGKIGAAAR